MIKRVVKKKSYLTKNKKLMKSPVKFESSLKKKEKERTVHPHLNKTYPKTHISNSGELKMEKVLIENFVSLQKIMTNLSIKFDNLTKQISKLLELFEVSAKTLAEKDFDLGKGGKDKKIIEKMDNLLEQNKIIARGLTLMHERVPEKSGYSPVQSPQQMQQPQAPKSQITMEGYQKSISPKVSLESPATQLPKPQNSEAVKHLGPKNQENRKDFLGE